MKSGSLRTEPAFVRWAVAEGVSMLGSSVTTVVLPIIVYQATGSAAQTGLLFAIRVVPYLLFGLIAGPLADRGNRRRLIIGGNVIEGCLVATIPIAHLFGKLTIAQIYVVALLSATAFVFSDAAVFGAVPALVGPERLPAANGLLATLGSGAEIAGPAAAGVLIAAVGTTTAIWVDAASFLFAAAAQSRIQSSFRSGDAPAPVDGGVTHHARTAITFIRGERTVSTLLVAGFGNSLAFGAVLGLLVPYAVERLGLRSDDGRVGILFGALGVGSLAAGLLFSQLFSVGRIPWLTPASLLTAGLAITGLWVNSSWLAGAALFALFSMSMTITILVGITYRQSAAPDSIRSSVNVIGRMVGWGGQPFGAVLGAVLARSFDVRTAYGAAAIVMTTTAVGAFLTLRRRSWLPAHERPGDGGQGPTQPL